VFSKEKVRRKKNIYIALFMCSIFREKKIRI